MRKFIVNDGQAWVMFDAESVQDIFEAQGRQISEEQAQDILDEINDDICDAMSKAGFDVIMDKYYEIMGA